jgi:hypothetical protein
VKNATTFVTKFDDSIIAVLSCFDRVILKGYLPFGGDGHLNSFVDGTLGIPRKDFLPGLERMSQQLVEHAQNMAREAGAPYHYVQGKHSKEQLVSQIARDRGHPEGLLAVLCCQETCRTVKLRYGDKRPRLIFAYRPQRVVYYYFFDPEFGRIHVRIQTWFPFTIQVYVNGHDWLAQQMLKRRLGFVQEDNAFTQLDNVQEAQALADRFSSLRWQKQLGVWARLVNPLLARGWFRGQRYHWVIDQSELSTDVIFRDSAVLNPLYRRLLDHAAVNFSAQDILGFLGRRLHPRFDGEVTTQCKKDRQPGARIKHRVKNNWLKMYDKFGRVLRIETVINQPREFKVRRARQRKGVRKMVWCPMNKGIANFYQYQAVSLAANLRYLEAISVVDDPAPSYQQVETLVQSRKIGERSYAGFNPARGEDVRVFQAMLLGDHCLRGFRNAEVRRHLFGESPCRDTRRRQSSAVGRILKRLHVRGLIAKIPHTRRWQTTASGHQLLGKIVRLYHHGLATAT